MGQGNIAKYYLFYNMNVGGPVGFYSLPYYVQYIHTYKYIYSEYTFVDA